MILGLILAAIGVWWFLHSRQESGSVSGTIEVDEVHVASRYGGRVQDIPVNEGDRLAAGQLIVQMDAAELEARRANAAAQLAELEKGPRVQEIEAAKREWQSQQAELEYARAEADRAQELYGRQVISRSEYDRTRSRADGLEKSTAAAQQRFEVLAEGTRPERIAQALAQLAEIEAQLREMRVLAPAASVVEVLSVKPGDVVGANREVATLLLADRLWVRVYVPELWLGHIRLGQSVKVTVDAWPGSEFEGVVEQINRTAEFTPRNVQTVADRIRQVFGIKIALKNTGEKLRAGMSADVVFPGVPPRPRNW